MIESITLENWKTHKNSTLKFRKGTNVLVGVIGSGKSSVTDALCYALFGTFPALQNRRVSTTDILMRKPFAADTAKVQVSFGVGEKKFKLERIIKRTGVNEGRLWLNETLIAGPKPSHVTERVEKELDVTYELFSRAVYSEQNQVDYFLKLNPGERKKKFDELLDLQKYETVRGNALGVLNHLRKSQESHKHALSQFDAVLQHQDVNEIRFRVEEQRMKKKGLEEKHEQFAAQIHALKQEAAALQEKVTAFEALTTQLQRLQSEKALLEQKSSQFFAQNPTFATKSSHELREEKKSSAAKLAEHVSKQEQHRLFELQAQKAVQRAEMLGSRVQEIESTLKGLSPSEILTQTKELDAQRTGLKSKLDAAQQGLQEANAQVKLIESQLIQFQKDQQGLGALHADCPTCKQQISPAHKEKLTQEWNEKSAQLLAHKGEWEKHYSGLLLEKRGVEAVLPGLEESIRSLSVLKSKGEEHVRAVGEHQKAHMEAEKAKQTLSTFGAVPSSAELEKVRTQITLLERADDFSQMAEKGVQLAEQLSTLQKDLERMENPRVQWQEAQSTLSRLTAEQSSLGREKELLAQVERELQARLQNVEHMLAQRGELESKMARAREIESGLDVFANSLIITQQQLREGVVEAINAALEELWPSLYPYQDFVLAKVVIQDQDYVLCVKERTGGWISAESSLSGGERSAAALALRMAIGFVLTRQLSWIILDEPTHNLDTKSVATLSQMLRERLPSLVDQVFVITHAPEIEKSATGSLYVLQREKNEDGCTVPMNKLVDLGTRVDSINNS